MSTDTTVEVPQPDSVMSAEAARELTDTIRARVAQVWDLIKQAYTARVWEALSYGSWDAYCAAEFDGAQLRIPREERSEIVASLREIGMSSRAIAAATGLARGTILKELDQVDQIEPPDSVVGLDGKTYQPKTADRESDPVDDAADKQPEPGGQPTPQRRRRPPITESFDTTRGELLTKANTLAKLAADARFDQHAEQLSHRFRSDLLRARDALQTVIDRLPDLSDRPEEG
ncbi:helix-turn-helix domain-containing protein [Nocardia sp. NPDC101769]|uniref:helix-turn-helix domain-containing protein n=1 Tax=Nocardia sp. NPDC101769 TaxID=3364333 RepID=UPI003824EFDF